MKFGKFLLATLLVFVLSNNFAFADETANIKLDISTPTSINKYFVCFPGTGCFSILGGRDKDYPIFRSFGLHNIYLSDVSDFRAYPQGIPASCDVGEVQTGQTLVLSGRVAIGKYHTPYIAGLSCRLEK